MKKIRILAILVILAFIGDMVTNGVDGAVDGWNEAGDSKEFRSTVKVKVRQDEARATDSLFNIVTQQHLPCRVSVVKVPVEHVSGKAFFAWVLLPVACFALYGVYCMVRVVLTVSSGKVFTRRNAKRMRLFVYGWILLGLWMEIEHYAEYQHVVSQLQVWVMVTRLLPTYSSSPGSPTCWPALFTEIFAAGVKMKEEQDLTI